MAIEDAVIIIGAGPAGLATAAGLRGHGVAARIVDSAGEPGGAYREIYEGMTLASPTVFNALPGLPLETRGEYTAIAEYRAYLDRYAEHHRLRVERGRVERVDRLPDGIFLVAADGRLAGARAVVVATGQWSFPVRPELLGLGPGVAVIHARDWRGPAGHDVREILVIGGGTSAVEIAQEAAGVGGTVHLSARSGAHLLPQRILGRDLHHWFSFLRHLPPWLARRYCARPSTHPAADIAFTRLRRQRRIEVHPGIARCAGAEVTFTDGSRVTPSVVVTATGHRFETPFLPPQVARAPGGHVVAREGESVSWPGLYVVGAPCAGHVESEFLRGIARDAPAVAARIAGRLARS